MNNFNDSFNEPNSFKQEQPSLSKYLLGFIGALLGALIGTIPWAIAACFGWFVGWLGFAIGFLSMKGYDLLGGKKGGIKKVIIICLTTVIGVVLGNMTGDILSLWKELSKFGATLGASIRIYFEHIGDPDIIGNVLLNLILGLVFAALGVWSLFKGMIAKEKNLNAEIQNNEQLYNMENTQNTQNEESPLE